MNANTTTRRRLVLLALSVAGAACGSDPVAPTEPEYCPEVREKVAGLRGAAMGLENLALIPYGGGDGVLQAARQLRLQATNMAVPECAPYAFE